MEIKEIILTTAAICIVIGYYSGKKILKWVRVAAQNED
jgi:hypothetical protein